MFLTKRERESLLRVLLAIRDSTIHFFTRIDDIREMITGFSSHQTQKVGKNVTYNYLESCDKSMRGNISDRE